MRHITAARFIRICTLMGILSYPTLFPAQSIQAIIPTSTGSQEKTSPSKVTQPTAEQGLTELAEEAKKLRQSALELIGEVERRTMAVVGEPDIMEPIVMPKISNPNPMIDLGDALPPRKKWLDIDMNNLGQLVKVLVQDVGTIALTSNQDTKVVSNWTEVASLTKDIEAHYQNLLSLTQGSTYDNVQIGKEALFIYDDTTKMEKPWKEVYHSLKK